MIDNLLKGMLRRGFKGKREVTKKEFRGNIRWWGRETADELVKESKEKGLIKTYRRGGRLELTFDLFK